MNAAAGAADFVSLALVARWTKRRLLASRLCKP